jgi:glutathione S-transferase
MADICLVPQVYNANRFNLDMAEFPNIARVADNCNQHPAFIAALPENQADAQH